MDVLESALAAAVEQDDEVLLTKLTLEEFGATPQSIQPFGASRLRWRIGGPVGGVLFELNRQRVPFHGERLLTPDSTTTLELRARIRRPIRVLGRRTVRVDLAACETLPAQAPDLQEMLRNFLTAEIRNDPDLYFVQPVSPVGGPPLEPGPIIDIRRDEIRFELRLRTHYRLEVNGVSLPAPDPSVNIAARFGLAVVGGAIITTGEDVSASVTVPWYVYALPGAGIAVPLILNNAQQRALSGGRAFVRGFISILNLVVNPAEGQRLHSVAIQIVAGSSAELLITLCPDVLLRRLVDEEVAPIE